MRVALGVGLLVLALPVASAAQSPAAGLSLSDAVARALAANRTIAAAEAARAIDVSGVAAARQRPNPEVTVEESRETPRWSAGASVPIEISGKRARRIDVANATLAVTDAQTAQTIAQVRADVRRAYYQVVAAARRVELTEELQTIATRARDAAQERFQTGAAPQLDALQANLALSQAQNDAAAAQGELGAARIELNTLLGYPPAATTPLSGALDAGTLPTLADVTQQALSASTDLRVLDRQIDEAKARVALAQAMRRPDPTVSASVTWDAQPEFNTGWRFGGTVAIPILTTGKPDVAVAEATLARAQADRTARATEISGAVASAYTRADVAHAALLRYQNEVLPASLRVEQMAQESYTSGETGLPALLQALQATRDVRQRALQAAIDYQLALADLEKAMGTELK